MKSILILFSALLLLPFSTALYSQQVISSGGEHLQKSSGSLSFTIGEIAIETYIKTNNILTQGFHQTNLIAVAVNEIPDLGFEIKAYPNPTQDFLILKVTKDRWIGMEYKIFDMEGKLIQNKQILGDETEISFESLSPSTYFIKVSDKLREVKTFKIVKQ